MLTHAAWEDLPGLRHGFLGRGDGPGPPWQIAGRSVAVPRQVHGAHVVTVPAAEERPEADGVATAGPLVGVLTADCVPVLLVDPSRRAAAAVHAGWRGAATGVLEAGIAHLAAAFGSRASDVEAVIGPAIGGRCYEVGPEVRDAFETRTGGVTAPAWTKHGERWHVDLRQVARCLLVAAGVGGVVVLGPCTRCAPEYHSYRRDGPNAGRQLSFVGWE